MALLARSRRPLALLILLLVALPALGMIGQPIEDASPAENRRLAPLPGAPRTVEDWRKLPRQLDAFAADHFAFRRRLMRDAENLRRKAGGRVQRSLVTEGGDGRLLLIEGLIRSTGVELDAQRAADYAGVICQVADRFEAQGATVAFGMAPSPTSVHPELAPDWAGPPRRPTEYDLILGGVARCAPTADLRGALIRARGPHALYKRADSHWTSRGALIAFNAMAAAARRPQMALDPGSLQWTRVPTTNGDLARMAGRPPEAEILEVPALPPQPPRSPLPWPSGGYPAAFAMDTGHPGPTVLVIGDSFSDGMMPYLAAQAGRVVWMHHRLCAFDFAKAAAERPDVVFILTAERVAFCGPGDRPAGFDAGPQSR